MTGVVYFMRYVSLLHGCGTYRYNSLINYLILFYFRQSTPHYKFDWFVFLPHAYTKCGGIIRPVNGTLCKFRTEWTNHTWSWGESFWAHATPYAIELFQFEYYSIIHISRAWFDVIYPYELSEINSRLKCHCKFLLLGTDRKFNENRDAFAVNLQLVHWFRMNTWFDYP